MKDSNSLCAPDMLSYNMYNGHSREGDGCHSWIRGQAATEEINIAGATEGLTPTSPSVRWRRSSGHGGDGSPGRQAQCRQGEHSSGHGGDDDHDDLHSNTSPKSVQRGARVSLRVTPRITETLIKFINTELNSNTSTNLNTEVWRLSSNSN
jgi:hypothetical protein